MPPTDELKASTAVARGDAQWISEAPQLRMVTTQEILARFDEILNGKSRQDDWERYETMADLVRPSPWHSISRMVPAPA